MMALTASTAAQSRNTKHHHYKFFDLGTFGGPAGFSSGDQTGDGVASSVILNRGGSVVGQADTSVPNPNYPNVCALCPSDPLILHAFRWHDGRLTNLGALPGPNSSFATWISEDGLIAGYSENGVIDPLLGIPEAEAVLWKDDRIIGLGTIEGSNQSAAFAVNGRGQVVGGALLTLPDPFSPFGFELRAFQWQDGVMENLGTLGGPESVAYFVNKSDQIVGTSYTDSVANPGTGLPTQDPFLWENGTMLDLGGLGGTFGTPNYFDDQGRIVGGSNLVGDLTEHAFLWTKSEGMQDLGTLGGNFSQANWMNRAGEIVGISNKQDNQAVFAVLWSGGTLISLGTVPGDACSDAYSINSKTQVVGVLAETGSFSDTDRGAFVWEEGHMIDLNTFLPKGAYLQQLTDADNINDRGEIVGLGVPAGCGNVVACGHAFLLIPCDDHPPNIEGCDYSMVEASAAVTQTSPVVRNASSGTLPKSRMRMTAGELATFNERNAAMHAWVRDRTLGFGLWPSR